MNRLHPDTFILVDHQADLGRYRPELFANKALLDALRAGPAGISELPDGCMEDLLALHENGWVIRADELVVSDSHALVRFDSSEVHSYVHYFDVELSGIDTIDVLLPLLQDETILVIGL